MYEFVKVAGSLPFFFLSLKPPNDSSTKCYTWLWWCPETQHPAGQELVVARHKYDHMAGRQKKSRQGLLATWWSKYRPTARYVAPFLWEGVAGCGGMVAAAGAWAAWPVAYSTPLSVFLVPTVLAAVTSTTITLRQDDDPRDPIIIRASTIWLSPKAGNEFDGSCPWRGWGTRLGTGGRPPIWGISRTGSCCIAAREVISIINITGKDNQYDVSE